MMMKKVKSNEKVAEIISTTRELSTLVIEQEAGTDITRKNFERIAAVSELLVANAHPVEPSYDNIMERGNVIYANFPARQTLKNRYRMLIGVWRGAYHNILHLLAEKALQNAMEQAIPSGTGSNSGETIHILRAYAVRLRAERDRAVHDLAVAESKLSSSEVNLSKRSGLNGMEGEILAFSSVRKWLLQLNSPDSLLEEDATGLRLSRLARAGRQVMDGKTLAVLRSL